ncbi:MAG TPA: NAD(P)/FAD-dependent oxidoreductase [Longimicrobiaceae bacterium]|nr:NAD(P)/FAD-dependent oxidoreductase [Longimicrobiaceae bacterium]
MTAYDAVVVGAGVNGLAAATVMAQAGRSVLVREANSTVGGAARSAELTLPGFVHDPFSSVYPLAAGSPFLGTLPLGEHGLEWVHPDAPLAHPFDDGTAALLERSFAATGATLGPDGEAYRELLEPLAARWDTLAEGILGPLRIPRHPVLLLHFGVHALRSVRGLGKSHFREDRARALLSGSAAHSALPHGAAASASFALVLNAAGHAVGWPFARGGSGRLSGALASYLRSLGAEIVTDAPVRSLDELPPARAVFLDLTPRQVLRLAGDRLPPGYRGALEAFRYGPGAFKVDWALDGPIPWAAPECARAGTVHLGGSPEEIAEAESRAWRGEHAERPFVLLAQPSLFDPTRAPAGRHVAWGYCHVPNGSGVDMTRRIEDQVERFAPGFRDRILARSVLGPAELERLDANLVGGDVNGGSADLGQLFFRPAFRPSPYSTPVPGLYLCSASTPPGGGVHGMCGFHAAHRALADGR